MRNTTKLRDQSYLHQPSGAPARGLFMLTRPSPDDALWSCTRIVGDFASQELNSMYRLQHCSSQSAVPAIVDLETGMYNSALTPGAGALGRASAGAGRTPGIAFRILTAAAFPDKCWRPSGHFASHRCPNTIPVASV